MNAPENAPDLVGRLTAIADQCVKCGLCLAHCPTYQAWRDEGDSPRGRIALIQGLTGGQLADSPRLREHLANCTQCLACETLCPSLVRFGELMDDARTLRMRRHSAPVRRLHRLWLDGLSASSGVRLLAGLGRFYRATGLAKVAPRLGLQRLPTLAAMHRLVLQWPTPASSLPEPRPAPAASRTCALFLGCIARAAQPRVLDAARAVLEQLGYRVEIPDSQGCCGAMHRHNGFPEAADRQLARNAQAFRGRLLVGLASACVAELRRHPALAQTQELCRLLADLEWPAGLEPRPLPCRVAVHEPCSQRHRLHDAGAAYALLRRIPGIELVALPENNLCCGAAGTYLLQRPQESRRLLRPKIEALARLAPTRLVTTNTGCALHLAAGLDEAGLAIEILHPVELLWRQWPIGNACQARLAE